MFRIDTTILLIIKTNWPEQMRRSARISNRSIGETGEDEGKSNNTSQHIEESVERGSASSYSSSTSRELSDFNAQSQEASEQSQYVISHNNVKKQQTIRTKKKSHPKPKFKKKDEKAFLKQQNQPSKQSKSEYPLLKSATHSLPPKFQNPDSKSSKIGFNQSLNTERKLENQEYIERHATRTSIKQQRHEDESEKIAQQLLKETNIWEEEVEFQSVGTQVDPRNHELQLKILEISDEEEVQIITVLEFGHLRSYSRQYLEQNYILSFIEFYEQQIKISPGTSSQFQHKSHSK